MVGVEVPVRLMFEAPTIAELAENIESGDAAQLMKLERVPRKQRLPLSFAQQRLWLIEQIDTTGAAYNLPQAMRLRGRMDAKALERALNEIVRRHQALRTVFRMEDGEPCRSLLKSCACR